MLAVLHYSDPRLLGETNHDSPQVYENLDRILGSDKLKSEILLITWKQRKLKASKECFFTDNSSSNNKKIWRWERCKPSLFSFLVALYNFN